MTEHGSEPLRAGAGRGPGGPRPLDGVRVLDLTRVLAGPLGTMVLGDLGADVVKIERPGHGDDLRAWGPPWSPDGVSAYFLAVNRNKRSVTLDLKSDRGRELFRQMVADADVVVENFRAGTMAGLGLTHEDLLAGNPRLVTVSLSAYGSEGPSRDLPAYDIVLQALGGVMSVTGEPDGRPMRVGFAVVDVLAGVYVALAVLAALRERDRTGEPQRVELSLLGVELASLVNVVHNYLIAGVLPERHGNAHPSIVPYDVFATADGYLALAVATEPMWARFCEALGASGLCADARFARNGDRVANRAELMAILEPALASRPTAEWVEAFRAADVPCGPVNSIDAILADPQVLASDLVREIDRPGGSIRVIGSPLAWASGRADVASPPELGRDTDAELGRLGLSPEEIDALRRDGVV
jgi:crotonobetainyl-CoA:carnitine CoA-transferase CaiB-like acyl-CoA transferase